MWNALRLMLVGLAFFWPVSAVAGQRDVRLRELDAVNALYGAGQSAPPRNAVRKKVAVRAIASIDRRRAGALEHEVLRGRERDRRGARVGPVGGSLVAHGRNGDSMLSSATDGIGPQTGRALVQLLSGTPLAFRAKRKLERV